MTQQYTPNIGQLCKDDARRDCIHFALAPVVAGEELRPGEHVGFLPNTNVIVDSNNIGVELIGIVDPFLKHNVYRGQKFWLMLYPNTVTSLRHVWSHPAFAPKVPNKEELSNG